MYCVYNFEPFHHNLFHVYHPDNWQWWSFAHRFRVVALTGYFSPSLHNIIEKGYNRDRRFYMANN